MNIYVVNPNTSTIVTDKNICVNKENSKKRHDFVVENIPHGPESLNHFDESLATPYLIECVKKANELKF